MNSETRVIVNGFLLNYSVPSEERLTVHVDLTCMPGYKHVDLINSLQDLLTEIDIRYREEKGCKREGKGRSVKARYIKDPDGMRRKILLFQPYPSMIVNGLKELRRQVYDVLNTHCIILQEESVGRMKRKLYFLPANMATTLMAEMSGLNEKLEEIKNDVEIFEASKDFNLVFNHLKQGGVETEDFNPDFSTIRLSPIPLSLSKDFYEQYLEEERKRALTSVDEARKRGLDALEQEIETKRRDMLEAIQRDLKQKFTVLLEAAEEAVKNLNRGRRSPLLKRKFEHLVSLVEDVGVQFDDKPFKSLGNVLEAVEKRDATTLVKSVNDLVESLGFQPTGNPERDMNLAAKAVRGESVLLFTIE